MKVIIVGGVAGGATAAARMRRNSETDEIVLIEKGGYISYANCGLPYYIGGVIADRDQLFLQTPASFGQRFNVDVRVNNEVLSIDAAAKTVRVRNAEGMEYSESYDKLLLSPGAAPVRPPLQGIDDKRIFTLRNVADTDAVKQYLTDNTVRRAVIIGGGFIGLEMAENLVHAGVEVAVVEMANQVMAPIDYSMASFVHRHLQEKGVHLHLEQAVKRFEPTADGLTVWFGSGERIEADLVLLSIGVKAETRLATAAGLRIGEAGGIWVNEFLQTSDESIYVVGDAIEFPHPITGKPWLNYLAGPANRQARLVADNLSFGNRQRYEGSIGTAIAKVFDLTVATTGLPAKRLKQMGIPYQSATIHTNSHAGYYPGASILSIKVIFSPEDGRVLGGQIVGYEGVDKRIDSIAQVIKQKGTIARLMELEHAYAPPFSSAKDPVAVAGYVANNIWSGKMQPIYWREIQDLDLSKVCLIDVRTPEEFALRKIEGAINLPVDELRNRLDEVPHDRLIVLYCGVGLRGYLASNILKANGYTDVRNLIGGIRTYDAATSRLAPPTTTKPNEPQPTSQIKIVDACGLQCLGPIMKLKGAMEELAAGEVLELHSTDAGFPNDAAAWCQSTGNSLLASHSAQGKYIVQIQKNEEVRVCQLGNYDNKGKTFILFSDDLDKTLATFVLANGAAATGKKVSIFFTFWGLNAIKKERKPKVKKDIFGKMFGMMLPSDSRKLSLSKMNMFGLGSRLMRFIMGRKHIDSLESLRRQAIDNGVEFIACQMSMDVMGIKREELLDEVTVGGVATYMQRAEQANVNLFI